LRIQGLRGFRDDVDEFVHKKQKNTIVDGDDKSSEKK
jgi:hypothetical protein